MKKIQAIFFDVDGTLVFNNQLSLSTLHALEILKKRGIKLFIATGRPHKHLASFKKICPFEFDGYIILNGQYCYTKEIVLREKILSYENIKEALEMLKKNHVATLIATDHDTYVNLEDELLSEKLRDIVHRADYPLFDEKEIEKHKFYQIMPRISIDEAELERTLMKFLKDCKALRWNDESMDIVSVDTGKDLGMDAILEYYQIPLHNTMAFGDGENDMDMLIHAGIGIAMGNAGDNVKKVADDITLPVEDDGIYYALRKYGLL